MASHHLAGDLTLNIARGVVKGVSSNHKFGAAPAMSQNNTGTVWDVNDTLYPWHVWDSSGTVTIETANSADSGVTFTFQGLDSDFNYQSETVTLSSLVDVTSTNSWRRINRAFIEDGVTSNTGNITIKKQGVVVARVNADKGQTLMTVYTIPNNKTGYLMQGTMTVQDGADANGNMFVRYGGQESFRVGHSFEVCGDGGQYMYNFAVPIRLPEKTDIDVRATVRSNNARVTSAFDVILVDDGQ